MRLFLARCLGTEHRFERVRIVAGVPCLGADGHWGGGEVLYLLQVEVKAFGYHGEFGHILFVASRVAAYEVRYDLLVETLLPVYAVEYLFEPLEQSKRRFAHVLQHVVARVLRRYLQSSAHVVAYQLARILACSLVGLLVLALVQQQVVAHSAAYEALLYLWQGVNGMINVEQRRVVGVEVGAYLRMDARRTLALLARLVVAAVHAVHVGRRSAAAFRTPASPLS